LELHTLNFLPLLGLAFGSFVLALSGALVPGPMFSATVAGSHRRGFRFGPGVVLGHALAEMPIVALLLLGLAPFVNNPWVLVAIGVVGAVMLVWMGVGLVCQSRRPPDLDAGAGVLRFGAIVTGFVTSILNPYWFLWWATVPGALLKTAQEFGLLGVGVFFAGHISADLLWYSATAFSVSRGRNLLRGRLYKVLLIGCATILFVLAVLFVKLAVDQMGGRNIL
jgi:threonine/homoserine/homoserine lactone efflux protein